MAESEYAVPSPGDLIFDCNFESGNIGSVEIVGPNEYDISILPDTNNPKHRLWFYFSVSNSRAGQGCLFHIVNFSKTRSLYRVGMSPCVRSKLRPKWERVDERQCVYYRSPRYKKNYVLSFTFTFDREDDVYYFAYCFPYTYTELQEFLYHLESKQHTFFRRELLCRTIQHRRVDLLTITAAENFRFLDADPEAKTKMVDSGLKKKMVFITARVHPGETPSQFVCHGLIRFLCSGHPAAVRLRHEVIFRIVPMLNPDGVFLGNYRCSSIGYDLNRMWLCPDPNFHPTVFSTRNLLLQHARDPVIDLDLFTDIHAHSTATDGFMYVNTHDDEAIHRSAMRFPQLIDAYSKKFSIQGSRYCKDPGKAGTGRRALGEFLLSSSDHCHCYTLEVSFFCHSSTPAAAALPDSSDSDSNPTISRHSGLGVKSELFPFTEQSYVELGRDIGIALAVYYGLLDDCDAP